jgi:hypothetical protein
MQGLKSLASENPEQSTFFPLSFAYAGLNVQWGSCDFTVKVNHVILPTIAIC